MSEAAASVNDTKVPRVPIEAHHVKKNKYVMLKGHPCKIVDVKTSKTGKHGHMKCNITGIDVLTGKKYNDVVPGHANMIEFKLDKAEYQLIDLGADSISCLDSANKAVTVACDPETDIYKSIKSQFDEGKSLIVSVIRAPVETAKDKFKDEEMVESVKEDKSADAQA
jgi:translation initiation factor 5A